MAVTDIGIDLGTSTITIYLRGTGIVVREPSVVAFDQDTNEIVAVGEAARSISGRPAGNIAAVHPLSGGVIANYTITERMLRYFMQKAIGRRTLRRPRVCMSVPCGASEVERDAVRSAALEAGARDVTLLEGPAAAALGAGIDISRACGNLVIDMGAGTTDIAVISLGMAVSSKTLKVAGNDFDEVLVRYMRREHGLMIGSQTAEEVKIRIGGVTARASDLTMNVKGRDITTGMPRTVAVSANETIRAFKENVRHITEGLRQVLEDTGPELSSDIAMRGILLTGGGSMLYGMDELIRDTTGIQTIAIDDPISVTAIGTGRYMEFMEEKTAKM